MNSEELEQSLRTEFESYLKNVLAEMRQEVSDFQKQFDTEFDKHKAQIDEVFQNFSSRIAAEKELDISFTESVIEHLRLSRDEGARITATAIAEAEELDKQNAFADVRNTAPTVSYSEIRDAINDISTKTTQSAILKTLVHHAGQFTPRGAFFIIKNEHLVGWRVFGKEGETADEHAVREVFFPVASSTILGQAVRSLSAVEGAYGSYSDDSIYLNKLEFSAPESMYAVPLVVRGRSVAALYADNGVENGEVNVDALETLVRVASLTVEVLASSRGAQPHAEVDESPAAYRSYEEPAKEPAYNAQNFAAPVAAFAETAPSVDESPAYEEVAAPVAETVESASSFEQSYSYEAPADESFSYQPKQQPADTFNDGPYETIEGNSFAFKPKDDKFSETVETEPDVPAFSEEHAWSAPVETESYYTSEPAVEYQAPAFEPEAPAVTDFGTPEPQVAETEVKPSESRNEYQFESTPSYDAPQADFEVKPSFELPKYETPAYDAPTYETPAVETPVYDAPTFEAEGFSPSNGTAFETEPVVETVTKEAFIAEEPAEAAFKAQSKSRFNERNVDLPIEVPEEERRHHNDARRFARLLVSEIKLYNEHKVKEGREGNDLYDRLREAIDRSREMYDKRVQPPVAAKFDYFHYELVSNLAEGDEAKLGAVYPGANV